MARGNIHRKRARWLKRMQHASRDVITANSGGGSREKARRVKQMLKLQLKAENGVEMQFEHENAEIAAVFDV